MSELKSLQKAFTEHLRDPDHVPVPAGLDERRMGVYSELIFNNVSALLSDFFPVIRSILSDSAWHSMVRNFFITHQSQTPYFMELSGEFVEHLAQSQMTGDLPDFLLELAHYEWAELAVYTMDEELPEAPVDPELLATTPLALSPLAWPLAYNYPVHHIRSEFQPTEQVPTCLLVTRNTDDAVKFFELQPLAYQLLQNLQENPGLIANDWLSEVADQMQVADKSEFMRNGMALLQSFNEQRLLIPG